MTHSSSFPRPPRLEHTEPQNVDDAVQAECTIQGSLFGIDADFPMPHGWLPGPPLSDTSGVLTGARNCSCRVRRLLKPLQITSPIGSEQELGGLEESVSEAVGCTPELQLCDLHYSTAAPLWEERTRSTGNLISIPRTPTPPRSSWTSWLLVNQQDWVGRKNHHHLDHLHHHHLDYHLSPRKSVKGTPFSLIGGSPILSIQNSPTRRIRLRQLSDTNSTAAPSRRLKDFYRNPGPDWNTVLRKGKRRDGNGRLLYRIQ